MIFSIWISAVIIQVGIVILLSTQFARYKDRKSANVPSTSIVIAAHNELANLKILVPKLLEQTHSHFNIVIALDRCTDKSAQFLAGLHSKKLEIVEIEETPRDWDHKKYALTYAIQNSEFEWIVLTDADCIPTSDQWLNQMTNRINHNTEIILGYSPYTSDRSVLQNFIQYEAFITAFNYLSFSMLGKPYMGVGRNLAVKRSFFVEQGGYSDFKSIVGGDDDLFIQKNATSKNTDILIGKTSLMFSNPKNTLSDYIHQKTRHLSVGTRYSALSQTTHLLFHGSLLLTWILIPFISLEKILPIVFFYLIVKWIGYRFAHSKMGVGFNYIWLPLVDLMYAVFLPTIAIRSKLVKDIRWKN